MNGKMKFCPLCSIAVAPGDREARMVEGKMYHHGCATEMLAKLDKARRAFGQATLDYGTRTIRVN
jgi:hypothetical protein